MPDCPIVPCKGALYRGSAPVNQVSYVGEDEEVMEQAGQEYLAVYRRDFSELEGLQKAEQVTYALQRVKNALCFHAKRRTSAQEFSCSLQGLDEAFAGRLLCYMYENAVAPEQVPDVLRDLCGTAV
ncbi:hypothetical protein [Subdoligranulum variabile]|uniref:hypothetical protein n=1 Tax=Subdoligranulum variabile TaxID=214851 RepID=UPI0026EE9CCD|nr:hypothetical protein [Subdoligranulum variabile]